MRLALDQPPALRWPKEILKWWLRASSPGASVGATPEILQMADKIIIEVNTKLPSFKGLHDIK